MTDGRADVLGVDMVRCAGHGICSLVFPDRVALDEWGFAQVDATPLTTRRDRKRAVRAARACPRRALLLNGAPVAERRPTVES
jgi:ferredoxin